MMMDGLEGPPLVEEDGNGAIIDGFRVRNIDAIAAIEGIMVCLKQPWPGCMLMY